MKNSGGKSRVYLAQFPFAVNCDEIYPAQRKAEIESCTNKVVRAQKYYVWKLLEYALFHAYGFNIKDLVFQKENGKWSCPDCAFSLSHCKNLCAVALSEECVGVDIEAVDAPRFLKLADKILTEEERSAVGALSDGARGRELALLWTKKEAEFKRTGLGAFVPCRIDTCAGNFAVKTFSDGGMDYVCTVAGAVVQDTEFIFIRSE